MSKPVISKPGAHVRAFLQIARVTARRLPLPLSIKLSMVTWLRKHPSFYAMLSETSSAPVPPKHARHLSSRDFADYAAQVLQISQTKLGANPEYVPHFDETIEFARSPLKLVAFYLPQFHPVPENDAWWGKGFTEWTNVSKAMPQYIGHYQPRLPGELGFYDLRLPDVMRRQVALAKRYGIHAFCFHHYWFAGKRLLEKPVNQFLAAADIDFSFCLCWANENWTRRWDGREHEVLVAQEHSPRDDIAFIDAIMPALKDPRYLRHNARPILVVYRAALLPEPTETAARWRNRAKHAGLDGLYLVAAQTFGLRDPRPLGFDAAIEFPPHFAITSPINGRLRLINSNFTGSIFDYEELAASYANAPRTAYPVIKTVSPSWDNEARKPGAGQCFHGANPQSYAQWLRRSLELTQTASPTEGQQPPFVFVNAWNEWAEGAYLEPDRRFGYGYLHATASVIRDYITPHPDFVSVVEQSQEAFVKRSELAIVAHLHDEELLEDLASYIANCDSPDIFVSLRPDAPATAAQRLLQRFPRARLAYFRNRGRDIFPFIAQLPLLWRQDYKYACKIHCKGSFPRPDRDAVRTGALQALLGSPETVRRILSRFAAQPALGLLAPIGSLLDRQEPDHSVLNGKWLDFLCRKLRIDRPGSDNAPVAAGSMFWFRPRAFEALASLNLDAAQFEDELVPIEATLAHAVEQLLPAIASKNGYIVEAT